MVQLLFRPSRKCGAVDPRASRRHRPCRGRSCRAPGERTAQRRCRAASPQAGSDQPLENVAIRETVLAGEVVDLDGGEGLDVQLRKAAADGLQQIGVVAERQAPVETVDDVDLGHSRPIAIFNPFQRLGDGHRISVGHAFFQPGKRAEQAVGLANVGRVEMEIAVVVRNPAVKPLTDTIGQLPHGQQIGMRQRRYAVLSRERRSPESTFSVRCSSDVMTIGGYLRCFGSTAAGAGM